MREEEPETVHPGGFWRYKHPFSPGFNYDYHTQHTDGTVFVFMEIEIDQGGGIIQRGYSAFRMVKTVGGYQILPDQVTLEGAADVRPDIADPDLTSPNL